MLSPSSDMDPSNDSRTFLTALGRHKWSAATGFVIVVVAVMFLSFRADPVYQTTADVQVPLPIAAVAAGGTIQYGNVLLPDQAQIAVSLPILQAVAERVGYQGDPQKLAGAVSVLPSKGTSQVLTFEVEGGNPQRTTELANAFVEEYLAYRNTEELDGLNSKLDAVTGRLRLVEKKLAHTPPERVAEYQSLLSQQITLSSSRNDILSAIDQVKGGLGKVLSPAIEPTKPARPDHVRDFIVAVLAGLFVAVGIAMLLETFDTSLRGIGDVEALAGGTVLASIPHFSSKKGGTGLVVLDDPRSAAAEAYRSLKTAIMFGASQQNLRVLVVTSASKGDGKSTTASNLAAVIAQADEKVLLVDGDLRRPSVHRIFKTDSSPGLSEVLTGKAEFIASAQKTEVSRLRILPSGAIPPNPVELLGSNSMEAFLTEVAMLFDWLIIDAPPALGVADASVLASQSMGVLFVVGEDTSRRMLSHARNQLSKVDAHIAGVVLNNLSRGSRTYYPEYGYAKYGYGTPGGSDAAPAGEVSGGGPGDADAL